MLIHLINIDAKVFNNLLANQNKQHAQKIMHDDPMEISHVMQGWFNIMQMKRQDTSTKD